MDLWVAGKDVGMRRATIKVLLLIHASLSYGHSGRTDSLGCHDKLGSYHCHRGALSGKDFRSKAEAENYLTQLPTPRQRQSRGPGQTEPTSSPSLTSGNKSNARSLVVISWNVKHMGRKNLDLETVASLLVDADIITFQEVNKSNTGQDALKAIAAKLRAKIRGRICWGLSEIPTGALERYAYLWKDSRVSYVKTDGTVIETCPDSAITIRLGVKHAAGIVREPAYGTFFAKAAKTNFVLASIHLVPSGKGPQLEVPLLFDTFGGVTQPTIVAGDFNLDSSHPSFGAARKLGMSPAMSGEKTSLKSNRRELSKAYDNFWFKGVTIDNYQVINLYKAFPLLSVSYIYKNISDHSPIRATFEFALPR